MGLFNSFSFSKQEFEPPSQVEINSQLFVVKVNYFSKKSSSVNLRGNLLEFRLSKFLSSSQKEKHFHSLLNSIEKKISKKNLKIQTTLSQVMGVGSFKFNCITYFVKSEKQTRFGFKNNTFFCPSTKFDLDLFEKYIIKILIKIHSKEIVGLVNKINESTYNYKIKNVVVKSLKSRWGHCTHDNEILINLKLLNGTYDQLFYVIIHELSHVRIKNHSASFWHNVSLFCPNYKELRKSLKENPPSIFK